MDLTISTQIEYLQSSIDSDIASGAEKLMHRASKAKTEFEKKIIEIQKSENLTKKGKQSELEALLKTVKGSFEEIVLETTGYLENAKLLELSLRSPLPARTVEEKFESLMRQREIRDLLRSKDTLEISFLYQEAIENNWEETALAIESAPRGFSLISDEVKADGLMRRAALDKPETAAKMKELLTAHESVNYVVRSLESDLEKIAGFNKLQSEQTAIT